MTESDLQHLQEARAALRRALKIIRPNPRRSTAEEDRAVVEIRRGLEFLRYLEDM